jgi:hypothetical protein
METCELILNDSNKDRIFQNIPKGLYPMFFIV